MQKLGGDVIFKIHQITDEEYKELLKPPGGNKWDVRWLQIPTFLRRPNSSDVEKKDTASTPDLEF